MLKKKINDLTQHNTKGDSQNENKIKQKPWYLNIIDRNYRTFPNRIENQSSQSKTRVEY